MPTELERHIRENKHRVQNLDELVAIPPGLLGVGYGPASDGLPHRDAEDELEMDLEGNVRRSFEHLVEIDVLEKFGQPSSPSVYVIAEWRDDDAIINGETVEVAQQAREACIDHMQADDPTGDDESPAVADGGHPTIRSALASEFAVTPEAVEAVLRDGDPVERLRDAVGAIEETDDLDTREDYGMIAFINPPKHYRVTEKAVRLHEQEVTW